MFTKNKVADSIAHMREILREHLTTLSEKFPTFPSLKAQQLRERHLPGFRCRRKIKLYKDMLAITECRRKIKSYTEQLTSSDFSRRSSAVYRLNDDTTNSLDTMFTNPYLNTSSTVCIRSVE